MDKPSPVPPKRRATPASACWNDSNTMSCLSLGMPMPVSVTARATTDFAWFSEAEGRQPPVAGRISTFTAPLSVNLKAFARRFLSTWFRRPASVSNAPGRPGARLMEKARFLVSATWRNCCSRERCSSSKGTSEICRSTRPDSILARSRIWLIISSRSAPEDSIVRANWICLGVRLASRFSPSRRARISRLLSGVRSSCDIVARKFDL